MNDPETAPQNPLLQDKGLTPEQQEERDELAGKLKDREFSMDLAQGNYKVPLHERTLSGSNGANVVELAVAGVRLGRAEKKATKHFNENKAAYQVQAVKDAASEGVDTNFGTEEVSHQKAA